VGWEEKKTIKINLVPISSKCLSTEKPYHVHSTHTASFLYFAPIVGNFTYYFARQQHKAHQFPLLQFAISYGPHISFQCTEIKIKFLHAIFKGVVQPSLSS